MPRSLNTLMTDLIDYAGLFPPAKLSMPAAVEAYNRARIGEHEWMLGRFVCPVSRLEEFGRAAAPLLPGTNASSGYRPMGDAAGPWRLTVLMDGDDRESDLAEIEGFNDHHAEPDNGLAKIDMCEIKVAEVGEIDDWLDDIPEDVYPFFEFPIGPDGSATDCRGFVAALSGNAAAAKVRTGGITANAFPLPDELAAFLHACAATDVPFKATAGLHHAVRGPHRLTYEKDAPTAPMHGFLNLFIAAAICRAMRPDRAVTLAILSGEEPAEFKFSADVLAWREHLLAVTDVARVREAFALSFGSCSFDEPIEELKAMGLL